MSGFFWGSGGGGSGAVTSVAGKTGAVTLASGDVVGDAPLASPTFTGTVTLPNSTVTNAMLAGSITAAKISASLDQFTAPAADVAFNSHKGTGVTAGVAVDDLSVIGQALEQYRMTQRGFIAWSYDPSYATAGTVAVSQSLYVIKVPLPLNKTYSITGCVVAVPTAGATLTSGQNLLTLYNQAGTKQGDTADQSAVWTTTGTYATNFSGGPYSIAGGLGNYCWVSFLSNGTTPASFATSGTRLAYNATSTGAATGASLWAARNGTTVTATATITPSSNVITAALAYWVGLF